MTTQTFISLRQLASSWNDAILTAPDGDSFLDRVGISSYEVSESDDTTVVSLTIEFDGEIGFSVPGMDGMGAYLGQPDGSTSLEIEVELHGESGLDGFQVRLPAVSAVLRFASLLRPVRDEDGAWVVETDSNGAALPLDLGITAVSVSIDSDGDIDVSLPDIAPFVSLPPAMIGDTGVVIEADQIGLYFSSQAALPSGAPAGFKGLYLDSARVYLPSELKDLIADEVEFKDCYIGSGGFTGSVSFSGSKTATLFGFTFTLTSVELSFVQNAIVKGAISGKLTIPFFNKQVNVALSLSSDGGFAVTLADADSDSVVSLTLDGVGTLSITSLGLGVEDGEATLALSGTLSLTLADLDWPDVQIQNLRISSDGEVQIDGGWIDLQEPFSLDLYGFLMEITQIGFGNEDDGRRWFGCSGGVAFPKPLPMGASVEGLRVIWDPDDPDKAPEITLNGIGVELTIPNLLHLDGTVALYNEDEKNEFKGNVSLELLPLGVSLDASVIIGQETDDSGTFKYNRIFLGLDLPVGIPVFATGTAIYGMAGLYGCNIYPATHGDDWYQWYKSSGFKVIDAEWAGRDDALAIGAGLTIGTLFDGGYSVSAKGLLVFLLPGPVIMLEAKADILKGLPDLEGSAEGAFTALAVLDALAGYFQLNIDAQLELAKIIDIGASAEAYFSFTNASAWHLYIGQDQPEDRRIHADVLALFHAHAYLMLDASSVRSGFGVSLGDSWKFGPVKVTMEAWLEGAAEVSASPAHLYGSIDFGGEFAVKVAGFGLGLFAYTQFEGNTPTAYLISGKVAVGIDLPKPLKDREISIKLEWKKEDVPKLIDPFQSASLEHLKCTETWPLEVSTNVHEPSEVPVDVSWAPFVPLDAKPVIVFNRPVHFKDDLGTGGESEPNDQIVGDYSIQYELVSVELERCGKSLDGSWEAVDFDPGQTCWAAIDGGSGEVLPTRLYLGVRSPFAYARNSSRVVADSFLALHPSWPCVDSRTATEQCVDWGERELIGTSFGPLFERGVLTFYAPESVERDVIEHSEWTPSVGFALRVLNEPRLSTFSLYVAFPEPMSKVRLNLECIGKTTIIAYSGGVEIASVEMEDRRKAIYGSLPKIDLDKLPIVSDDELEIEAENIEWVEIKTLQSENRDNGYLLEYDSDLYALLLEERILVESICFTTQSEADAVAWNSSRIERLIASGESWGSEDQVFDPETRYRLKIITSATLEKEGTEQEPEVFTHYAYFQTGGPPGILPIGHAIADPPTGFPDAGFLTDLQLYTKRRIPEDGAVAVYSAYDLGMEPKENYVEQMYGADLVIQLRDRNDQPVTDGAGEELELENQWGESPTAAVTTTDTQYYAALEDCELVETADLLRPQMISASASALFYEDFEGTDDSWVVVDEGSEESSSWIVSDGEARQEGLMNDGTYGEKSPEKLGTLFVAGDSAWTDFAMEVEMESAQSAIGIVFRYSENDAGDPSYYRLSVDVDSGYRRLVRMTGGVATVLWENTFFSSTAGSFIPFGLTSFPFDWLSSSNRDAYPSGDKFTLCVRCEGDRIRGQLDGEYLFDVEDTDAEALGSGKIALYTWRNAGAHFYSVLVRDWPDNLLGSQELYAARLMGSHVLFNSDLVESSWPANYWESIDIGDRALVGEGQPWKDYQVHVTLNALTDHGAGVLVRYSDSDNYCRLLIEDDLDWSLVVRSGGTDKTVASGFLEPSTSSCHVVITCEGGALLVELGEETVFDDSPDGMAASGSAGLLGSRDSVAFSEFQVLSAPRQSVLEWKFTTSRYRGFSEHCDSFSGTVYELEAAGMTESGLSELFDTDLPSLRSEISTLRDAVEAERASLAAASDTDQAAKIDSTLSALEALHNFAWETYVDLLSRFLGEDTYRALPESIEIHAVHSAGVWIGLLIESPEPFVWSRIDWEMRQISKDSFAVIEDPLVVWSEDQTRALIIPEDPADLPEGEYELRLTFHLDRGPEAAVLRRGSSTLPEVACLTFTLKSLTD
ncbi:MAG TPA: family 16 glycoside hydrolase [Phycisphaerae bacterium]|nr:family 16 glycoside hydrolase [Phycisphaerae bacterium]